MTWVNEKCSYLLANAHLDRDHDQYACRPTIFQTTTHFILPGNPAQVEIDTVHDRGTIYRNRLPGGDEVFSATSGGGSHDYNFGAQIAPLNFPDGGANIPGDKTESGAARDAITIAQQVKPSFDPSINPGSNFLDKFLPAALGTCPSCR